ncbi:MAG: hypothetical protein Q7S92_05650 [Candidatus Diapherotrites archaeon]|nr:hypothetical protein [Candidatus Diapherotrites archaeon]
MNGVRFNLIAVFFLLLFLVSVNSALYSTTLAYNEDQLNSFKETGFNVSETQLKRTDIGSGVNEFSVDDTWVINVKIFPGSQTTGTPLLDLLNAWFYAFSENRVSSTIPQKFANKLGFDKTSFIGILNPNSADFTVFSGTGTLKYSNQNGKVTVSKFTFTSNDVKALLALAGDEKNKGVPTNINLTQTPSTDHPGRIQLAWTIDGPYPPLNYSVFSCYYEFVNNECPSFFFDGQVDTTSTVYEPANASGTTGYIVYAKSLPNGPFIGKSNWVSVSSTSNASNPVVTLTPTRESNNEISVAVAVSPAISNPNYYLFACRTGNCSDIPTTVTEAQITPGVQSLSGPGFSYSSGEYGVQSSQKVAVGVYDSSNGNLYTASDWVNIPALLASTEARDAGSTPPPSPAAAVAGASASVSGAGASVSGAGAGTAPAGTGSDVLRRPTPTGADLGPPLIGPGRSRTQLTEELEDIAPAVEAKSRELNLPALTNIMQLNDYFSSQTGEECPETGIGRNINSANARTVLNPEFVENVTAISNQPSLDVPPAILFGISAAESKFDNQAFACLDKKPIGLGLGLVSTINLAWGYQRPADVADYLFGGKTVEVPDPADDLKTINVSLREQRSQPKHGNVVAVDVGTINSADATKSEIFSCNTVVCTGENIPLWTTPGANLQRAAETYAKSKQRLKCEGPQYNAMTLPGLEDLGLTTREILVIASYRYGPGNVNCKNLSAKAKDYVATVLAYARLFKNAGAFTPDALPAADPNNVVTLTITPLLGGKTKLTWTALENPPADVKYNPVRCDEMNDDSTDCTKNPTSIPVTSGSVTQAIDPNTATNKTFYNVLVEDGDGNPIAESGWGLIPDTMPEVDVTLTVDKQSDGAHLSWGPEGDYVFRPVRCDKPNPNDCVDDDLVPLVPLVRNGAEPTTDDTSIIDSHPNDASKYQVTAEDPDGTVLGTSPMVRVDGSIVGGPEPSDEPTLTLDEAVREGDKITLTWTAENMPNNVEYNVFRCEKENIADCDDGPDSLLDESTVITETSFVDPDNIPDALNALKSRENIDDFSYRIGAFDPATRTLVTTSGDWQKPTEKEENSGASVTADTVEISSIDLITPGSNVYVGQQLEFHVRLNNKTADNLENVMLVFKSKETNQADSELKNAGLLKEKIESMPSGNYPVITRTFKQTREGNRTLCAVIPLDDGTSIQKCTDYVVEVDPNAPSVELTVERTDQENVTLTWTSNNLTNMQYDVLRCAEQELSDCDSKDGYGKYDGAFSLLNNYMEGTETEFKDPDGITVVNNVDELKSRENIGLFSYKIIAVNAEDTDTVLAESPDWIRVDDIPELSIDLIKQNGGIFAGLYMKAHNPDVEFFKPYRCDAVNTDGSIPCDMNNDTAITRGAVNIPRTEGDGYTAFIDSVNNKPIVETTSYYVDSFNVGDIHTGGNGWYTVPTVLDVTIEVSLDEQGAQKARLSWTALEIPNLSYSMTRCEASREGVISCLHDYEIKSDDSGLNYFEAPTDSTSSNLDATPVTINTFYSVNVYNGSERIAQSPWTNALDSVKPALVGGTPASTPATDCKTILECLIPLQKKIIESALTGTVHAVTGVAPGTPTIELTVTPSTDATTAELEWTVTPDISYNFGVLRCDAGITVSGDCANAEEIDLTEKQYVSSPFTDPTNSQQAAADQHQPYANTKYRVIAYPNPLPTNPDGTTADYESLSESAWVPFQEQVVEFEITNTAVDYGSVKIDWTAPEPDTVAYYLPLLCTQELNLDSSVNSETLNALGDLVIADETPDDESDDKTIGDICSVGRKTVLDEKLLSLAFTHSFNLMQENYSKAGNALSLSKQHGYFATVLLFDEFGSNAILRNHTEFASISLSASTVIGDFRYTFTDNSAEDYATITWLAVDNAQAYAVVRCDRLTASGNPSCDELSDSLSWQSGRLPGGIVKLLDATQPNSNKFTDTRPVSSNTTYRVYAYRNWIKPSSSMGATQGGTVLPPTTGQTTQQNTHTLSGILKTLKDQ